MFANPFGNDVQKLMNFTLSMIRKFYSEKAFLFAIERSKKKKKQKKET